MTCNAGDYVLCIESGRGPYHAGRKGRVYIVSESYSGSPLYYDLRNYDLRIQGYVGCYSAHRFINLGIISDLEKILYYVDDKC